MASILVKVKFKYKCMDHFRKRPLNFIPGNK